MSIAEDTTLSPAPQTMLGVVHGRTIELDSEPRLPDGQRVSVQVQPVPKHVELPSWPTDVVAFAREQHVEQYLPKVLDMTRRVFPSARRLNIFLEEDPEIADDRHIVFRVEVVGLDVPVAVAAQSQWCREIFDCCPSTVVCVFRISLEFAK